VIGVASNRGSCGGDSIGSYGIIGVGVCVLGGIIAIAVAIAIAIG